MKKILIIVLTFLMIFSVFFGCVKNSQNPEKTKGTEHKETKVERIYPNLPEITFDGDTINFVEFETYNGILIHDLDGEESDESRLSTEIFRRNNRIENEYDVKITNTFMDLTPLTSKYEELVWAGDQDVDVFFARGHEMQNILPKDLCLNLYNLPECDFSMPWWDKNSVEQFSIDNKLYLIESDITLRDKNATACCFFNKQVVEDYPSVGNIYNLVGEDSWTWDKMIQLSKIVTKDFNGDAKMDEWDQYGLVAFDDLTYIMLHGGGAKFATKDSDDLPVPGFRNTRTMEVGQAVVNLIYNEEYFYHLSKRKNPENDIFQDDRALFFADLVYRAAMFNDMKSDFGIMPIPKYNEAQKDYCHSVSIHFCNVMSVPKTNNNLEKTSVILEALAADSKYTVIPEFYDIYVKVRNTRDEDAQNMLDLIFNSRVYDLGEFFQFGGFNMTFLRIWSYKAGTNLASIYERYDTRVENAINDFIDIFSSGE